MCDIEENNIQYTPAPSFLGKERGGANTNVVSISSGGDRIDDSKLTTKKRNIYIIYIYIYNIEYI